MMEQLTFVQQIQQFSSNHTIMVIAWLALMVALILNFYKSATSKYKIVDNAQVTLLINTQDAVILDVRSDEEFRKGHIIDSIHILPSELKAAKVLKIEKYKALPVIVADGNGLTAPSLANLLVKQGFSRVYMLKEGVMGWHSANLPLVKNK